ncbi:hypothetical protein RB195_004862 [Necator americanus]|uniref:DUF7774 domain-containing protein n=1 Tax=Necator americanus TaxID=51031 RepID=A0ABR1BNC7_NECAM
MDGSKEASEDVESAEDSSASKTLPSIHVSPLLSVGGNDNLGLPNDSDDEEAPCTSQSINNNDQSSSCNSSRDPSSCLDESNRNEDHSPPVCKNGVLDLSRRALTSIDRKHRKVYGNVRKLIISANKFHNVAGLDMFRNCVLVDATDNQIQKLSSFLPLAGQLRSLFLSNNGVKNVDNLRSFVNLETLDLSCNSIEDISNALDNHRLAWIDLSSNALTSLPDLSKLTSLKHLNVSSNRISSFKHAKFPPSLLTLDVSSNTIDDLTEFMRLLPLEKLESISLANNPCIFNPSFDYRIYILSILPSLQDIDGFIVSEEEQLKGEWLYSQGKGRMFKPDTGSHLSLVKHLERHCPFDVEGKLVSALDQSVVKAMEKRREMLSSSTCGDDSSQSLSLHSPYRAWTSQLEGKENRIPSSSADESGVSNSPSVRIPLSSTPARQKATRRSASRFEPPSRSSTMESVESSSTVTLVPAAKNHREEQRGTSSTATTARADRSGFVYFKERIVQTEPESETSEAQQNGWVESQRRALECVERGHNVERPRAPRRRSSVRDSTRQKPVRPSPVPVVTDISVDMGSKSRGDQRSHHDECEVLHRILSLEERVSELSVENEKLTQINDELSAVLVEMTSKFKSDIDSLKSQLASLDTPHHPNPCNLRVARVIDDGCYEVVWDLPLVQCYKVFTNGIESGIVRAPNNAARISDVEPGTELKIQVQAIHFDGTLGIPSNTLIIDRDERKLSLLYINNNNNDSELALGKCHSSSFLFVEQFSSMLGRNIGTKVGAQFVNTQYQAYLTQVQGGKKNVQLVPATAPTKKVKGAAQKRAEMRRKGIYVQADSSEFDSTIMEKTSSRSRPFVMKPRNRVLKWKTPPKKPQTDKKPKVISESAENMSSQGEGSNESVTLDSAERLEKKKSDKNERKTSSSQEQVPSSSECPEPETNSWSIRLAIGESTTRRRMSGVNRRACSNHENKVTPTHRLRVSDHAAKLSRTEKPAKIGTDLPAKVYFRSPKRDDIFAPLEDDVDLMKVLVDFNAANLIGVRADDRRSLETAQKILKIASREKAFEKTLTKEENEVLGKFFSGKIPYDAKVLHTLDSVLDKNIDYFRTHKTNLDPEVNRLIEKRGKLKAAMLTTMLSKPKLLPAEWIKQYEAYQREAMRETKGINWPRVCLLYPTQRTFDDGAADVFGNFTRARRGHWLWGVIFGPSDSKTFEEVDKEKKSEGFFLDTAIIRDAKENDTTPALESPPVSEHSKTMAVQCNVENCVAVICYRSTPESSHKDHREVFLQLKGPDGEQLAEFVVPWPESEPEPSSIRYLESEKCVKLTNEATYATVPIRISKLHEVLRNLRMRNLPKRFSTFSDPPRARESSSQQNLHDALKSFVKDPLSEGAWDRAFGYLSAKHADADGFLTADEQMAVINFLPTQSFSSKDLKSICEVLKKTNVFGPKCLSSFYELCLNMDQVSFVRSVIKSNDALSERTLAIFLDHVAGIKSEENSKEDGEQLLVKLLHRHFDPRRLAECAAQKISMQSVSVLLQWCMKLYVAQDYADVAEEALSLMTVLTDTFGNRLVWENGLHDVAKEALEFAERMAKIVSSFKQMELKRSQTVREEEDPNAMYTVEIVPLQRRPLNW